MRRSLLLLLLLLAAGAAATADSLERLLHEVHTGNTSGAVGSRFAALLDLPLNVAQACLAGRGDCAPALRTLRSARGKVPVATQACMEANDRMTPAEFLRCSAQFFRDLAWFARKGRVCTPEQARLWNRCACGEQNNILARLQCALS